MMKRIFALLLCAATLLSCLSFVGCDMGKKKKKDGKEEDKGQYITAYLTDNVYDLDPAKAYTNEALANVVSLMFDTLFKLDKNGKVKKSLVEECVIEENEAAGEYTMKLYLKDTH
jgi:ABC-type oligopeptide transport system substrate-binding subunit